MYLQSNLTNNVTNIVFIVKLTSRDSLKDIERDPILVMGCDISRFNNFLIYISNDSLFTLKNE